MRAEMFVKWRTVTSEWNITHKSWYSLVCGVATLSPIPRYASVLPRASRKHLVCMRAHNGSKTLWNWLPIQFTGGRKRKRRVAPALLASPLIFFLIHFLPLSLLLVRSRDLGSDWYLTLATLYILSGRRRTSHASLC